MNNTMETYDSNLIKVSGNTWVALGGTDTSWLINSVGGVPIELVILDRGIQPDENTKKQFTVGGIINNIVSPAGKQCWFRCTNTTDVGLLSLRPASLGPFNEISMVKASITDIHTQMINLSTRLTKNELLSQENQLRLNIHEYVIQGVQASMANLLTEYANMNVRIATSAIHTKKHVSDRVAYVENAQKEYEQTFLSMQAILSQIIANHAELNTKMRLDFNETRHIVNSKLVEVDRVQSTQNETIASLQGTLANTIASYIEAVTKLSIKTIHNKNSIYALNTQFTNLKAKYDYILYILKNLLKDIVGPIDDSIIGDTSDFVKKDELAALLNTITTGSLLIYTHLLVNEIQSTTIKVYFNQLANADAYTTDDLKDDAIYILLNMLNTITDPNSNIDTVRTHMLNYITTHNLNELLLQYLDILTYLCRELKLTTPTETYTDLITKYSILVNSVINNTVEALITQTEPPVEQLP
jgi:hypothetical protein